jgi:uncharacterized protein
MNLVYRKLNQNDFEIFDDFLKDHAETSMFLRSNIRKAGIDYEAGNPYKANYYGAFQQGCLQGVIAFYWNGQVLIQCPNLSILENFIRFIKEDLPQFKIKYISGQSNQSNKLKDILKIKDEHIKRGILAVAFRADLAHLNIPLPLKTKEYICRHPQSHDFETLIKWRIDYEKESFDEAPSSEEALKGILFKVEQNALFVLEHEGQIVSVAEYIAKLPDSVQIGGVYTPIHLRRKQYGRAVVAGALLKAYENGVQNSVLFSSNTFAMQAYESLGYKKCEGDSYTRLTYYLNTPFLGL